MKKENLRREREIEQEREREIEQYREREREIEQERDQGEGETEVCVWDALASIEAIAEIKQKYDAVSSQLNTIALLAKNDSLWKFVNDVPHQEVLSTIKPIKQT